MSSLRSKAGRALGWDLLGNYSGQVIGLVISIFLARLLEPAEFGLVGMSLVFITVLNIFAEFGFTSALVQNKDNSSLTYSSVFYINVVGGFLLAGALFGAAPLIAQFYKNDKITLLVRLFSLIFIFNSFSLVPQAILQRKLDFRALNIRAVISQAVAGVIAVYVAFRGFGVYALVVQQVLSFFLGSIILWRATEWRPKWEFSWHEVKGLTSFSGYVFASNSMYQFIQQADMLVVGKLFSPTTLGYFSRANSLNSLITRNSVQSIAKVFFPVLSAIRDDDEKFKQVYLKLLNIVSGISIFLAGIFFLCGQELIIILFGEKWQPSVFIFKVLLIKGFTYPISIMIINAFLAKGKSKEDFYYGNIRRLLLLTPFVAAYWYGFEVYLYTLVGINIINWLMNNYFVTRTLHIPFMDQTKAVFPYLMATIIIVVGIHLIIPQEKSVIVASFRVVLFTMLFALFCYLFNMLMYREFMFYRNKLWGKLKTAQYWF